MNSTSSEPYEPAPAQKAFIEPMIIDYIVNYCNNASLPPLCRVNQVCFDVITSRIYRSVRSDTRGVRWEQDMMGLLRSESEDGDRDSLRQELRAKIHHLSVELDHHQRYWLPLSEPIKIRFPNLKVLQLGREAVHRPDIVNRFPKVDTLIMDFDPYKSDDLIDYIRRSIPLIESSTSQVVIRWFRDHSGSADAPLVPINSDVQPAMYIVWTIYRAELYFLYMMYGIYGCLKCYGGITQLYISRAVSKLIRSVLEDRVDNKKIFKSGDLGQIVAGDVDPVMAEKLLLCLEDDMDYFGHDESERRAMFSKLRLIGDAEIDKQDWHKQFCRDWKYLVEVQNVIVRSSRLTERSVTAIRRAGEYGQCISSESHA